MTSPTLLLKNLPIPESVACIFIDIHLDEVAKRDLAIWFAEHPDGDGRAIGADRRANCTL